MGVSALKMILVGSGFMGREHLEAAKGSQYVDYVGVVDVNAAAAKQLADQYGFPYFDSISSAVAKVGPSAADVCVPTQYHLNIIKECAHHGLHVLCEKPIARNLAEAVEMSDVAAKAGIRLMVAQVLRFWGEYVYAAKVAASKTYGEILAIDCKRFSSPPSWNSWMLKDENGSSAAIDLQIHDMDFVQNLLGVPQAIDANGQKSFGGLNRVSNTLKYMSDIPVYIESSFVMPQSYPFRMFFRIEFERAILEMDFWRPKGQRLMVYPVDGEVFVPAIDSANAYAGEIEYFARCILSGEKFEAVPLEQSIMALKMCLASVESCNIGCPVVVA